MIIEFNNLDNPVYNSLAENHEKFALDYGGVKFYNPQYCSFGGFTEKTTAKALAEYALLSDNFYVVGEKPDFKFPLKIANELICVQMILLQAIVDVEITVSITELNKSHMGDLFELVNLVQPGYFKNKTSELGQYYGIYENGKLIAAGGERMKMEKFTELSAIVTHPEHTGKGYASQLITYASDKIFNENKIPYLHVADTNTGAIKLYEKLGFRKRRIISFWHFGM